MLCSFCKEKRRDGSDLAGFFFALHPLICFCSSAFCLKEDFQENVYILPVVFVFVSGSKWSIVFVFFSRWCL